MSSVDAELRSPGPSTERPMRLRERLRLVHHHPGYLRMQADAFEGPAEGSPVIASARSAAEALPAFRSWSHNPKTGSVVVEYEPGLVDADDLLAHVARKAGFRGVELGMRRRLERKELVATFLDSVRELNTLVGRLTADTADLRELVPAALVATSVVSFVLDDKRGRLPHWASALYQAYRIFMQWHRREVRESAARHRETASER